MITPDMLEAAVSAVHYHKFENTKSCVCALVLKNGHVVVGEAHCALDVEFDPRLAMEFSRRDAEQKLAPFLAFQQRGPLKLKELT